MKTKEDLILEFNEFSKGYTEKMINCVPHYEQLVNCFISELPADFVPKNIMDLGCGPGNVTQLLMHKYPKATFTLVDASNEMINLCKRQFSDNNITYHECYFQDYPFPTNEYDLVVGSFSFHHCNAKDKQSLFKNIYKSLRIGGILTMSDLFINKKDKDHAALNLEWKTHVLSNYKDEGTWHWLMEHYEVYDHPDNFKNQKQWLLDAGFSTIIKPWEQGHWIHAHAIKQ